MSESVVFYRLPHTHCYHVIRQRDGQQRGFMDYGQLAGKQGFVVAPFHVSADCPIVLIEGSEERYSLPTVSIPDTTFGRSALSVDESSWPFTLFHQQLMEGSFLKVVLSRVAEVAVPQDFNVEELFFRACQLYPWMMVTLVDTPQTGCWLVATPEVLLETAEGCCHTMALAGTQNIGMGEWDECGVTWDEKNRTEQRYVASYIEQCLKPFADTIDEQGPYTQRAGHLAHLCSDFYFRLNDPRRLGELLAMLHPTPAVCGLPKEPSLDFILTNEPHRRRYYSGFMGPLDVSGETHLYVTLRCMEQAGKSLRLYAGGGLIKDSQRQKEWEETEAKLDTMRRLMGNFSSEGVFV